MLVGLSAPAGSLQNLAFGALQGNLTGIEMGRVVGEKVCGLGFFAQNLPCQPLAVNVEVPTGIEEIFMDCIHI